MGRIHEAKRLAMARKAHLNHALSLQGGQQGGQQLLVLYS